MVNDAHRAYFDAVITRSLFTELPEEEPGYGSDVIGKTCISAYTVHAMQP